MPVERLSHPSDGTSRKLCALSDFEFRVWSQYKLCANDFGVMVDSPAPLMAENRSLERRGAAAVRKALSKIISLDLLLVFDDQGDRYVCSPAWQNYQRIRYPRGTHLPLPNGDILARCSPETRELFAALRRQHPGSVSETVRENSGNVSVPPARVGARNAHANADPVADQGEREREAPAPAALVGARFETFWDAYPRKVGKQDAEKAFAKLKPDSALLTVMLDALARQKVTPGWRELRYVPHPATWLNGKRWQDVVEPGPKSNTVEPAAPAWHANCPHRPKCVLVQSCADAWAVERARLLEETEVTA